MNNSVAWPELLKARLGMFMDEAEAEMWHDVIQDAISNVTDPEILAAVRTICERKRIGELPRNVVVDANMVISAIIRTRFMAKSGIPASVASTKEQRLEMLKSQIVAAPNDAARWEIICSPMESTFWPLLEQFAIEKFPDFKRPIFVPITAAIRQLQKSMMISHATMRHDADRGTRRTSREKSGDMVPA